MPSKPKVTAKLTQSTLPNNFFSAFKKKALLLANETNKKFAREIAEEAKRAILDQRFDWEPLKPAYLRSKQLKELDERIYIATGEYVYDGIGWWEDEGFVFVGPKPGTHSSGLTYQHLARIHEFGTWMIPARPLWRPLLSEAIRRRKTFAREYADGVKKAEMRLLRSKKKRERKVG